MTRPQLGDDHLEGDRQRPDPHGGGVTADFSDRVIPAGVEGVIVEAYQFVVVDT